MNELAAGAIDDPAAAVRGMPLKKYLYSYILNTQQDDGAREVTDAVLGKYLAEMKEKADAIQKGTREAKTQEYLDERLFIAYKENVILEKYFGRTLALTKRAWGGEKAFVAENLSSSTDGFYESAVSSRIVTGVTRPQVMALLAALLAAGACWAFCADRRAGAAAAVLLALLSGCATEGAYRPYHTGEELAADAFFDEPAWEYTRSIPEFTNIKTGEKVKHYTVAELCRAGDALYVKFVCRDTHFQEDVTERDGKVYTNDAVEIFIDPVGDGKHYYEFEVNSVNTVFDAKIEYRETNIDFEEAVRWNCEGLETAVRKDDWGYSVEMKIPLASMGLDDLEGKRPRFNLFRIDRTPGGGWAYYAWSPTEKWFHEPDRFRRLLLWERAGRD